MLPEAKLVLIFRVVLGRKEQTTQFITMRAEHYYLFTKAKTHL